MLAQDKPKKPGRRGCRHPGPDGALGCRRARQSAQGMLERLSADRLCVSCSVIVVGVDRTGVKTISAPVTLREAASEVACKYYSCADSPKVCYDALPSPAAQAQGRGCSRASNWSVNWQRLQVGGGFPILPEPKGPACFDFFGSSGRQGIERYQTHTSGSDSHSLCATVPGKP